jgi:elongation of very long chain fatty acids protein 7
MVFIHSFQVQFQPNCGFPKIIAALLSLNAAIFTYMFSAFYIRSYKREAKIAEKLDANGNEIYPSADKANKVE